MWFTFEQNTRRHNFFVSQTALREPPSAASTT
jgi:hypothetical protein